ncbi:MAG: hypothetical protein KC422_14930 [Trueperaceae bacterium]|nr:hypothetical protein [Trueperaceae bacterium]
MLPMRFILRLCIYGIILLTFFLGLPQVHYAAALMIAIMIRHKDEPKGIFGPINSTEIQLPVFARDLPQVSYDIKAQRLSKPSSVSKISRPGDKL